MTGETKNPKKDRVSIGVQISPIDLEIQIVHLLGELNAYPIFLKETQHMTETPSASALLKCDMAGDYTRLIRERTLNLDLMLQGKKQGKDAAHLFLKVIEKGMKIKMDA